MNALMLFEGLSLVELVIWGFIASNMTLAGVYILRRGLAKRAGARGE